MTIKVVVSQRMKKILHIIFTCLFILAISTTSASANSGALRTLASSLGPDSSLMLKIDAVYVIMRCGLWRKAAA